MMRLKACFLYLFIALLIGSCDHTQRRPASIFTAEPPQSQEIKEELKYLKFKEELTSRELANIDRELVRVEESLGVPKALLWCVLFQESRLNPFKNALEPVSAKGIGQFTSSALEEVNMDTDHYDLRTSSILKAVIHPHSLPIDFNLKEKPLRRKPGTSKTTFPEQSKTSYFRATTAIHASAAFLNNRYQQLKTALDHQKVSYDPQILWIYAAAAYNKGSRAVFLLLTHEYLSRGEEALETLLHSVKASQELFAETTRLDYPLREVWTRKNRTKYVEELLRNMAVISSCALARTQP